MIEYKHERSIPWENNKEEWERSFRNKWEGANADKRNWAISTEAMNDMVRDISTLLHSQKQSIMDMCDDRIKTHTHNSIPCLIDNADEGCVTCIKNLTLSDLKERINKEI